MRVWHLSLHMLVCVFLIPPVSTPAQQQAEPIRVSVDRVGVGAIVTDSRGKFVEGLRREDFHVFDEGVEQPITDFATIEDAAQVLMLVESGPAVYFLEGSHLRAAHALLDGLSGGDRVAVVKYDQEPQPLMDFTPDKQAATGALANVRFYVGFGALNLSRSLSTVLDWLANVQGKKTIVLLSTGFDTSAPKESSTLLARLKTGEVRLLAVSLGGELRNPAPNPKSKGQIPGEKSAIAAEGFADADLLLSALTQITGGRVYFPNTIKEFAAVYAEIAQLVRHEYSLAFAPSTHDGKTHKIEVRVYVTPSATSGTPVPDYRIDHRRAYVAPAQ
jgi:Ca-activated chloride channel family protein